MDSQLIETLDADPSKEIIISITILIYYQITFLLWNDQPEQIIYEIRSKQR